MFTYGLLPNILLPTTVQGESATIIDNIFTNNIHIGPFYAGPYWRYFWFAALIRAGVKSCMGQKFPQNRSESR